MTKPVKFDESGDSADLQALFDSIAAAAPVVAPPSVTPPDASGDSADLQALFDSVSAQVTAADAPVVAAVEDDAAQDMVYNRLGHLARKMHDSLRELGYDKTFEETARQIPDARERLQYIARMTEQAALKVLNACDIARPAQDNLARGMAILGARWEKMFSNQLSVEEFKQLAVDSRNFFAAAPAQVQVTTAQLNEIMLAQDFQDLTGQVIKKVVDMVQNFEGQVLQVLIDVMPEEKKAVAPEGLMNGPVINADGRSDVLTSQAQVDDLLESLGF